MNNSLPGERILTVDQLISQIIESNYNGNRFCFILGSGASVESGIPTGSELEKRWMDCIMGEKDDASGMKRNPEAIRNTARALNESGKLRHSFTELENAWKDCKADPKKRMSSEYYFDIYKLRFYPDHINGYRYLERVMEHCKPSVGYHPLSLLLSKNDNKNNLVITTNFDSLMEDALSVYSDKKPLIVGHESLAGFITADVQRPIIAKVHRGLFYDPFNTPETTDRLSEEWRKALRIALNIYTPIVIGYGGGDSSLMAFLEENETAMRHGIYWCYLDKYEPDERIRKLVESKDGYFVPTKGFDALMLEIGKQLFGDCIHPAKVEQYLKGQTEERIKQYNEQWAGLNQKPELETIVKPINQTEQANEAQRETEGKLTYWDYKRRADRAEARGDFSTALQEWTHAIERQPGNPTAYNNRGYVYERMGKSDEAIMDFKEAIVLNPDFTEAYNNLAYIYDNIGKYDEAIINYTKAIELNPDYVEAYDDRGYTYNNIGKKEEAIRDFIKAIELKPDYANPHRHLGNAYLHQGELQLALTELSKAIVLNDHYVEAYEDRAQVYHRLGKLDLAEKDEEKAGELKAKKRKSK